MDPAFRTSNLLLVADRRSAQQKMVDEYEEFLKERNQKYIDDIGRWESEGGKAG